MNIVDIPDTAIEVATMADLTRILDQIETRQSSERFDLFLSGLEYEEFGIFDYTGGAAGNWLSLYFRPDGRTTIGYTGQGHRRARSAVVRIGSLTGTPVSNVRMRNPFVVDGRSTDDDEGAIFGFAAGGSFDRDPSRTNLTNVDIEGPAIRNLQQWGFKFDGDGGSRNLRLAHFEISDTGTRHDPGESDGFGEGLYIGDGNTGRPITDALIELGWLHDINFGEGAEVKQGCRRVVLSKLLLERVLIDNGAAIKVTSRLPGNAVADCVVDGVSVTSDSDTGFPVGIQTFGGCEVVRNHVANTPNGYSYDVTQAPTANTPASSFGDNYANAVGARGAIRTSGTSFYGPHIVPVSDLGGNTYTGPAHQAAGWWNPTLLRARPSREAILGATEPQLPAPPVVIPPAGPDTERPVPIIVRAKGDTGTESLDVLVNGQYRSTIRLATEYSDMPAVVAVVPEGAAQSIELRFTNDSGPRNVTIDSVQLGDLKLPASMGMLVDPAGIVQSYNDDGRLYWNSGLLFAFAGEPQPEPEPEPTPAPEPVPTPPPVPGDLPDPEPTKAQLFRQIRAKHTQLAALYAALADQDW